MNIDWNALEEWLTIGLTLNRKTFEKGVKYKIPEILKYNGIVGEPSINRVIKAYENSIIKMCDNKKNILLQLSGGKDSRLVAALLKKNDIDFSAVVYGDGKCLDVRIAKMVAKILKIPIKAFTDAKGIYNMKAVTDTIKSNHGLRSYTSLLNQHYFRDYLRQFDLVLDGYQGNYIFDSHCCLQYPSMPWLYLIRRQYAFIPCCIDSKKVFLKFARKYYDITLEEAWVKEINNCRALDFATVQKWGINDRPVIDQRLVDAVYALPYKQRSGIVLTQKMMKSVNKTLWLLPYASYGGLPFAVPYKWHVYASAIGYRYFPNWKFADPSASRKYSTECFSDYIKTLPDFVNKLPILQTNKCLELLETSDTFRNRLMNFKIWSEINE